MVIDNDLKNNLYILQYIYFLNFIIYFYYFKNYNTYQNFSILWFLLIKPTVPQIRNFILFQFDYIFCFVRSFNSALSVTLFAQIHCLIDLQPIYVFTFLLGKTLNFHHSIRILIFILTLVVLYTVF